jgi:hypothetical protein
MFSMHPSHEWKAKLIEGNLDSGLRDVIVKVIRIVNGFLLDFI